MHSDGWGIFMGLHWWLWIAILLIVIVLIPGGIKFMSPTTRETPREILDKRYARGEIGKEEYERMKQELSR